MARFVVVTRETRFEIIETDFLPVIPFKEKTTNVSLTCKFDPATVLSTFSRVTVYSGGGKKRPTTVC